jgi:hypothetical protein
MRYISITSTISDEPIVVGPLEGEGDRTAWYEGFWARLDELNQELGLGRDGNARGDAIGAELESTDRPLGHLGPQRLWSPMDAVAHIRRQYEESLSPTAA